MQSARYILPGVGRIPLHAKDGTVRSWATVDLEDFARLCARGWYMTPHGYVIAHVPGSQPKRKEMLHRFLIGCVRGDGLHVDHKDHDRLNNRRSNLRVGTQAQNNQNHPGWRRASSAHRGVCWYARDGLWQAEVTIDRKRYFLGRFTDELEAAGVAAEFRRKHMPGSIESEAA